MANEIAANRPPLAANAPSSLGNVKFAKIKQFRDFAEKKWNSKIWRNALFVILILGILAYNEYLAGTEKPTWTDVGNVFKNIKAIPPFLINLVLFVFIIWLGIRVISSFLSESGEAGQKGIKGKLGMLIPMLISIPFMPTAAQLALRAKDPYNGACGLLG